jgi:hypothetical protein
VASADPRGHSQPVIEFAAHSRSRRQRAKENCASTAAFWQEAPYDSLPPFAFTAVPRELFDFKNRALL